MARYVASKGKRLDSYRGIRVSPEVYEAIRAEAEIEGTTLLATVEAMIKFYTDAAKDE